MSSGITSVRTEIKAWEREFKEMHGREPTVDDIKKQPAVAQKYKLYKKLSKAAAASSSSTVRPNDPPSTPLQPMPSTSKPSQNLLRSASRVVKTTAPLTGFNPFSPQKTYKGKEKEAPSSHFEPTTNPSASLQKSKTRGSQRLLSPDTFPPIEPAQCSTSAQLPLESFSVVSRARKRLRGEPVSPSPNKEKRRRVLSPASLSVPKLQLHVSGSDSDATGNDGSEGHDLTHLSIVDDSPMKPPATGKAFTYLFEEVIKPAQTTDLFGNDVLITKSQQRDKLFSMDEDVFSDDLKAKKTAQKSSTKAGSSVIKAHSASLIKSRPNLIRTTLSIDSKLSSAGRKQPLHENCMSTKCPPSELKQGQHDMMVDSPDEKPSSDPPISAPRLLPPSPNPNALGPPGRPKPTGTRNNKHSEITRRKNAKIQDSEHAAAEAMEDDGGSGSDSFGASYSVKLVHLSRGIRAASPTEGFDSRIEDPVLNYAKRVQPRVQGLGSSMKQGGDVDVNATPAEEDDGGGGNTTSDDKKGETLPNKLRRMMLLESFKSRQNEYEEEKIVKGLLSGRRLFHYDSRKGGEIWGVGEDNRDEFAEDEDQRIDEGIDEWEGDPVPWEVGELSDTRYHLEES